jgi:CRISPR-associated protein Csb2
MTQHLVLTIRLHDQRYHGTSEWPPAPARVFQALVAGVARGSSLPATATLALEWMESLPPPAIAAPRARRGTQVDIFVPNNDADAVGGDPARISEIRTKKTVRPYLLDNTEPLIYAWPLLSEAEHAVTVVEVADQLYQLGRGVDMAWAVGELIEDEALSARLAEHRGTLHRPGGGEGERSLPCPTAGSLESLLRRHEATLARLRVEGTGNARQVLFSQPPKPRFVQVAYESSGARTLYELRDRENDTKLWPWSLSRTVSLIERLRDSAAARLKDVFPDQAETVERILIGRKVDGSDAGPIEQRVRIVPLPSIGHEHVDRAIRRVMIDVPAACPLRANDVQWAFTGLEPWDQTTGVLGPFMLTPADEHSMLVHYGSEHGARRWRSVTPAALPTQAMRRRIEPSRRREEAKGASERAAEEARAVDAVRAALRHAGVHASAVAVRVQREPFEARGTRAEAFGEGTRFAKERLWHVELELNEPVIGPLLLGDGRFLGLGLMAPVQARPGIFAFTIDGDPARADGDGLVRAMRRAVMSRAQAEVGAGPLPRFFSGHEEGGASARSDKSNHIAIQWDPVRGRLLIIAPHLLDHGEPFTERHNLEVLGRALEGFTELRAGRTGLFRLTPCSLDEANEYLRHSRTWVSVRPYTVTRHRKASSTVAALTEDTLEECRRRGLPRPIVTVLDARGISGRGLEGKLRLDFEVAVEGPVVLGRTRYLGGGLFCPVTSTENRDRYQSGAMTAKNVP